MGDRYIPGVFDTPPPRFNTLPTNADPTPGVVAGKIIKIPGMRGMSGNQFREGVTFKEFNTILTQTALDSGLDSVTPVETVHVSYVDAVTSAVSNFAQKHVYRPHPSPGFSAEELNAHGWNPPALTSLGTGAEEVQRCAASALVAYTQVLSNPARMWQVAQFLGLAPEGPDHFVSRVMVEGTVLFDITGQGQEGKPFTMYDTVCECSSVYEVQAEGGVRTFGGVEVRTCPYVRAACDSAARRAGQRFVLTSGESPTPEQWRAIYDAASKNEWVGQLGEDLYVQTVGNMCPIVSGVAFTSAAWAVQAGTIGLDDSVVVDPHPPLYTQPPTDVIRSGFGPDGRPVHVFGPSNRYEKNVLTVVATNADSGEEVLAEMNLLYAPQFGYDMDDMSALDETLSTLGVTVDAVK